MSLRGHMAVYCQDGIPVQFVWPALGQPSRGVSPLKLAKKIKRTYVSIQLLGGYETRLGSPFRPHSVPAVTNQRARRARRGLVSLEAYWLASCCAQAGCVLCFVAFVT
jgi:hypothetical protein